MTRSQYRDVRRLCVETFIDSGLTPKWLKDELFGDIGSWAKEGVITAVTSSGRIVGCCALFPWGSRWATIAQREGDVEIRFVAVDKEWRGQGIGDRLIQKAVDFARPARMLLWTKPEMTAAKRLYERHGFRLVGALDWQDYVQEVYERRERE